MATSSRPRLCKAIAHSIAALCLSAAAVHGVAAADASEARSASRAPKRVPDLQGIWTAGTLTPLERPPQFANKPLLAPEETAQQQRRAAEQFWAAGHRPGEVGRDNDAFIDDDKTILPDGRTSLIVEPSNGLLPLQPRAERRRNFNLSSFDSYETMSQWDRCITREPTTLLGGVYNTAFQIVQTPTHVVIVAEMIHDARIVPLDGSAHLDSRIKSWAGDSRGRWEGDALVVETRNFNGRGWIATAQNSGNLRGVPFSEQLRMIERFTAVDDRTLNYEITIEDPQAYTSAFKIAFPLTRDEGYRMFEYACHEGNTAIEAMMRGARAQEQEQAGAQ